MSPPAWRGMLRDLPREHGFEPLRVEGHVPDDLRGALYRNGPSLFGMGGTPYKHWFDADGAITAVRLGARQEGACKVVQTRWLDQERAAGHRLYRNYAELGRSWRRWFALPKNTANISVMPWGGQVLALWEAGLPIALDPDTLDTVGEVDLGGAIGPTLSAHPHRVGQTVFTFGVHYGLRFSLDIFAFDLDSGAVRRLARLPLPRPTIVHDFAATPRTLVFFCPPVRLRLGRLLAGVGSFDENLAWEPEHGTEVIVVPLSDPERPVRFAVPGWFQWHVVHAWEEGDALFADLITFDDFATDAWFGAYPYTEPTPPPVSRYQRARVDLRARTVTLTTLADVSCEFPGVHPHAAGKAPDATWMLTFDRQIAAPPALVRLVPETGALDAVPLGPDCFPSEPLVAPGGEAGWVLSLVYDGAADASFVAVVDAAHPSDGPVAKLWFDHAIPFTFHGWWQEDRAPNPVGASPRWS